MNTIRIIFSFVFLILCVGCNEPEQMSTVKFQTLAEETGKATIFIEENAQAVELLEKAQLQYENNDYEGAAESARQAYIKATDQKLITKINQFKENLRNHVFQKSSTESLSGSTTGSVASTTNEAKSVLAKETVMGEFASNNEKKDFPKSITSDPLSSTQYQPTYSKPNPMDSMAASETTSDFANLDPLKDSLSKTKDTPKANINRTKSRNSKKGRSYYPKGVGIDNNLASNSKGSEKSVKNEKVIVDLITTERSISDVINKSEWNSTTIDSDSPKESPKLDDILEENQLSQDSEYSPDYSFYPFTTHNTSSGYTFTAPKYSYKTIQYTRTAEVADSKKENADTTKPASKDDSTSQPASSQPASSQPASSQAAAEKKTTSEKPNDPPKATTDTKAQPTPVNYQDIQGGPKDPLVISVTLGKYQIVSKEMIVHIYEKILPYRWYPGKFDPTSLIANNALTNPTDATQKQPGDNSMDISITKPGTKDPLKDGNKTNPDSKNPLESNTTDGNKNPLDKDANKNPGDSNVDVNANRNNTTDGSNPNGDPKNPLSGTDPNRTKVISPTDTDKPQKGGLDANRTGTEIKKNDGDPNARDKYDSAKKNLENAKKVVEEKKNSVETKLDETKDSILKEQTKNPYDPKRLEELLRQQKELEERLRLLNEQMNQVKEKEKAIDGMWKEAGNIGDVGNMNFDQLDQLNTKESSPLNDGIANDGIANDGVANDGVANNGVVNNTGDTTPKDGTTNTNTSGTPTDGIGTDTDRGSRTDDGTRPARPNVIPRDPKGQPGIGTGLSPEELHKKEAELTQHVLNLLAILGDIDIESFILHMLEEPYKVPEDFYDIRR